MWWPSVASASTFMPPAATSVAVEVDNIYSFLIWSSLVSFILLIGGMIYFVVKYKRKGPNDKTAYITHNHTLEFLWSFIPFLIFMFVFAWGWWVYHKMRYMPENALEVHVFAKKWDWRFVYKSGKEVTATVDAAGAKVPATMVVPIGRPVKLIMASEKINPAGDSLDRPVLHSFFVPAFRVKQDIVPGRYTALTFTADKLGLYNVFCAEYCGAGHSMMRGLVRVVTETDYENWIAGGAAGGGSLVDQGRNLYSAKACIGCHSMDGSKVIGPSFKGLFGKSEETDKGAVKVDEDYLRESILQPAAKTVSGFTAGTMPPYAGQLSDDEINALIEFIKTIK